VDYYRAIGEAADRPLLIYYLALAAKGPLDAEMFAEHLAPLPNVFAMKYTSPDLETFAKVVDLTGDKLNMVMGCDQLLLPALTMGARAAIGTTYNFMPELAVGTYDAWAAGDLARAQQLMWRLFRVIHMFKRTCPTLEACRAMARMRGFDIGCVRAPLPPISEAEYKALQKGLDELDFFSDPIR